MMKAIDKLREITKCLKSNGFESAEKEAGIFVRQGLNITTVEIYRDNPELNKDQIRTVEGMLERRLRREPFQYIVGYEEFMGLKLVVGPGVLIPRPETEFMAEQAIKKIRNQKSEVRSQTTEQRQKDTDNGQRTTDYRQRLTILDLCTGSGCLALALAKEFPDLQVYGTDISEVTVEYAKKNAEINGIKNVTFLKGNLFEPIERLFTVDLIISNPPYIKTDDIGGLQPEIKEWEPMVALDGGADGIDFYRELVPAARHFLKDEGLIMLELGAGQASTIADIIEFSGYTQIEIIRDYAGIGRIIQAKWKR